jgi:hypothetical protein
MSVPTKIVFDLTTICVLPRDSIKFVVAQFSLERFRKALERYMSDCGGYPNPVVGIKALVVDLGIKGWNGPYTKQPLTVPWQRPYIYEISNGLPVVRSLGADGKPGGDMFDGDLSSQTRSRHLAKANSTPLGGSLTGSHRGLC